MEVPITRAPRAKTVHPALPPATDVAESPLAFVVSHALAEEISHSLAAGKSQ